MLALRKFFGRICSLSTATAGFSAGCCGFGDDSAFARCCVIVNGFQGVLIVTRNASMTFPPIASGRRATVQWQTRLQTSHSLKLSYMTSAVVRPSQRERLLELKNDLT